MMFTHFGITGPLVLSASAKIGKFLQKGEELNAFLDLKPALSHEQLDDRILREFSAAQNKTVQKCDWCAFSIFADSCDYRHRTDFGR